MFLILVVFSSLLKTGKTDLKCFMHIIMKTMCLLLRVIVQKLSAESGLACDFMRLHICCGHIPAAFAAVNACLRGLLLCTSQPLSSLCIGTRFRRCVEEASESPLLNFCHQHNGTAGMLT